MRAIFTILSALPFLFAQSGASQQTFAKNSAAQSRAALESLTAIYPGLTATVIRNDRVVWNFEHGVTHADGTARATAATRFNIYSTTKALTGLAFARLVDEGRVALTDKVGEIAPDLPRRFHGVRLKDILTHTSGIRHYRSPGDWLAFAQLSCATPNDAVSYFADDPLTAEPGSEFSYSTFAFVVASELLIRLSGAETFETSLNWALGDWADYKVDGGDVIKSQGFITAGTLPNPPDGISPDKIIPLPPLSAECKFGGGGVVAGSHALARAGAALFRGEIFRTHAIEALAAGRSELSGVSYGAALSTHERSGQTLHHWELSGGAPGGRSYLFVSIEDKVSVAITGNFDGPGLGEAARTLAEIWREQP